MQCDRLSPVEQPDLLHHIFSFLGRESYLFVAPVCKIWRETYRRATGSETPQTKVLYALENLAVLQFGKANKLSWDAKCFALLCGKGDLPMVLWAAQNNIPFDYRALCCAARSGALPVVMYLLHKHGIVKAVEGQDVCAAAAAGGHLHVLKYLRDHGFHWDDMVTLEAAYYGHLHIIEYARSQNCPWHTNVASVAAYNGDLELLKWLIQRGAPFDATACSLAAFGGNLSILKWLRGQGCHWDERVIYEASCAGNFEILQWALQNGCPNS